MSYRKLLGTLYLIIGIGLFSTIELGQKFLVQRCGSPLDSNLMVFVRFTVTGLLLLLLGLPAHYHGGHRIGWRDLGIFLLNGCVGITFSISLFHYAIDQFQNASSAAVVFSANGVFVIVFARFINHETWTLGKWLATVTGLLGILLFMFESGAPSLSSLRALCLMSFAAMLFALSVCFTKRVIARYGSMVLVGGSALCGGLLALVFFLCSSGQSLSEGLALMGKAPGIMAYYVLIATALAYWMLYLGISHVSAFESSMAFLLKPVLACFLAQLTVYLGILPGESSMNAATISGTAMIIVAIVIAQVCSWKCSSKSQEIKAPHHE